MHSVFYGKSGVTPSGCCFLCVANHCISVLQITMYLCCKWCFKSLLHQIFKISIFHHAVVAEGIDVGGGGQNVSPPKLGQPPCPSHPFPCTLFFAPPLSFFAATMHPPCCKSHCTYVAINILMITTSIFFKI
jgi:hypothetical protein